MVRIAALDYEIFAEEGTWGLIPTGDEVLSTLPVFEVTRGGGVMEYTPAFGEAHSLPGTVLSLEYVRAVVIGYDEKARCWMLGFHVARTQQDKPRWLELVRWPAGVNEVYAASAQQAGRELAEHVGCPLKVFGAKKLPRRQPSGSARTGVTGPLVPHQREDIGAQRVRLFAQSVTLPAQYPSIWLGRGRNGITLRLAKDAAHAGKGDIAPAFNQVVFDPKQERIRLIPPTGLLGTFLGGQRGRELPFSSVRNIELRHTITRSYVPQQEDKDLITEITFTNYSWEVFLTLADESLLLAQTTHATSSELSRKRATVGDKFSVNSKAGIEYLRQHKADQEAYEAAENFTWTVAIVIADTLEVNVVKTQVEEEPA